MLLQLMLAWTKILRLFQMYELSSMGARYTLTKPIYSMPCHFMGLTSLLLEHQRRIFYLSILRSSWLHSTLAVPAQNCCY